MDRRRRVVLAVDGSKAIDEDISTVHSLHTNSLFAAERKPGTVVGDSHYGGMKVLTYSYDQGVRTCMNPRIYDRTDGRFSITDFTVIADGVEIECPAGQRARRRTVRGPRIQFQYAQTVCNACRMKSQCT